ncbi:SRPBCC family protein [Nocardioides jejuensis]|uniref:SRPBCC family protein n=1 Tax=Nocardioides jejuensis TaxID=2502782 RepID=A0A4R1C0F5_9ACTN|nr:SRPBCC family protein [Nocardioides jejuensis]TCJ23919.1 SRPBCC family protein [Nocardioides jejuensis]
MATTPVTVTARRQLTATPAALFATLVDPVRMAAVKGITKVTVLKEGTDGPQSVGTQRRVGLPGGAYLVEEFADLDAPTRFDYKLLAASTPLDHRFGRIEFVRRGAVTEATWTSTYVVPVPLVGAALTQASRPLIKAAFHTALGAIDAAALKATA